MDSCEECGPNEMSAAGAAYCTACGGGTVASADHTACGKQNSRHYILNAINQTTFQ